MNLKYGLTLILILSTVISAETFAEFINRVNGLPPASRPAVVDSFLIENPLSPHTEDTLCHFTYNAGGSNIAVAGDFTGWDPTPGPFTQVSATNFWYRTEIFENDARLDYKIVVSGSNWILDPRNPYTAPGGFGDNSELRMPAYIPPEEILYFSFIPHGTLEDTLFYSTNLSNTRQIRVYLPPNYHQTNIDYPVMIVHDGLEYLNFCLMNNIIDYLLSQNQIAPIIAVFIPPVNRTAEYSEGDQQKFTNFIANEIFPWLHQKYRISQNPVSRGTMGSSNGGNISLWLAMNHPEIFGKVAAFSPYIEPDIQNYFATQPQLPLDIYINHGTHDHIAAIHHSVNQFIPTLIQKQYTYLYEEYHESHSYGFWRAHIDDALKMLFPPAVKIEKNEAKLIQEFRVFQNYPNPFNATTQIKFDLPQRSNISLQLFDVNGRMIRELLKGEKDSGNYIFSISTAELASGIYYYRFSAKPVNSASESFSHCGKMVLIK